MEHPGEPRQHCTSQQGNPRASPKGKTHSSCQDTSTSLAKTQESLPGVFACLLTLAVLGVLGRDRDALLVPMPLLHLQPHQCSSAGTLPITIPVWEEGMLAQLARALSQTQRRRGKCKKSCSVSCNASFSSSIQNKHQGCSNRPKAPSVFQTWGPRGEAGTCAATAPQEHRTPAWGATLSLQQTGGCPGSGVIGSHV